jgi:hypothetical protein
VRRDHVSSPDYESKGGFLFGPVIRLATSDTEKGWLLKIAIKVISARSRIRRKGEEAAETAENCIMRNVIICTLHRYY